MSTPYLSAPYPGPPHPGASYPGSPHPSPGLPSPASTVPGPIAELVLPYDPTVLRQTVRRRQRALGIRLISLGVSLLILLGIYVWRRTEINDQGAAYWIFCGVVWATVLVPLALALIAWLRLRRELERAPQGIAVRMGRPGVVVADTFARWDEVAALEVVPGGPWRAERLRLRTFHGAMGTVPLDQVVVHPATLDGTARAYSNGRQGVDLTRLDT